MANNAESLGDRLAVQDVIVRYAACIDDRDFRTFRGCFTGDARFVGFGSEVIEGPDAWTAFVEKAIAAFRATQHMLGPPWIELHGDEAKMRTDLQAQHWFREPSNRVLTLWGTYHSTVVRGEGEWRLSRHELRTRARITTEA